MQNGKGKFTFINGDSYEGMIINGIKEGKGKYTSADGSSFQGNFKNDKREGDGTYIFDDGSKYVGSFHNNKRDGSGIEYYANGDRYEGEYKDDRCNGQGILHFVKGGILKGVWKDDEYISGSDQTTDRDSGVLSIVKREGVWETSVLINGVLKLDLIFDTGASDVFLTPDIVLTLYRTKTITENDILEGGSYVDANGNINMGLRFRIRELNIGGLIIKNVDAGVANSLHAMNLLGLSAIEKLGKLKWIFLTNQ